MTKIKFDSLPLSEETLKALTEMGFEEASPIQSLAIPIVLQGKDVIGQAQTGTGKTAAFGIPAIELCDPAIKSPQTIVLCPTRELAVQVSNELKKIAKFKKGINVLPIFGGESFERQVTALKRGVQIVVGTPGRVIDHLTRKTLSLQSVKQVILDEADEMLNMGFVEDLERILSSIPKERQTILFSATMAEPIMKLTRKYQTNPELVKVVGKELTVDSIEQFFYDISDNQKVLLLKHLVEIHQVKLALVFCNTKRAVDELVEEMQKHGLKAEGLHGDLSQNQRNHVMGKFRNYTLNLLVATDVAARGIDVNGVDAVFNYDVPLDNEFYVHRIGRTGRAGNTGKSFTFVSSGKDFLRLKDIQNYCKVKIARGTLPTGEEILKLKKQNLFDQISSLLTQGVPDFYSSVAEEFNGTGISNEMLSAALVRIALGTVEELKDDRRRDGRSDRNSRGDRGDRSDRGFRGDRDRDRGPRGDRDRGSRDRFDRGSRGDRFERGSRGERSERGPREDRNNGEKMVRLFINLGKKDRISPGDIVGAFASNSSIQGKSIGSIDIYDSYSFIEVPEAKVDVVMSSMDNNKIKGKTVNLELASKRRA
ncbi:RNA helicase [Sporocytophaga myxococcoides]|uniref:DEAD-box ATP-dependent RNA helicase RhpA n=1 Tax=Sporocytophaga myxococcoides TaxID=153721 RepID=A0A098L8I9_9BACT|nr:DEAD/DEAH box helicase [Sporocytophaga myxococcoides]GAL83081.1 RNA helicase [Sporocytophaga myxococcoides]